MLVLLVEDNAALAANVGEYLENLGDGVDFAYNGKAALELATRNLYDVIVLDLGLPGIDGLTLCRRLREEHGSDVPVLMLTARDTLDDKVAGFGVGADDYLTKPFDLVELRMRIAALARRRLRGGRELVVDDLVFDTSTMEVRRAGRVLRITPTGLRLLQLLMRRAPAVVPRGELERTVWGDEPPESEASLRVHMHELRQAIEGEPGRKLLHTVRGFGYRLGVDEAH